MFSAKDFLNKVNSDKNKSDVEKISDTSRASMTGLVIGSILGLYVGYTRKYNLLLSVFIGGASGSLISKALLRPKTKSNESK